eukprot:2248647-Pleurochrysis_carterae.AAC.3
MVGCRGAPSAIKSISARHADAGQPKPPSPPQHAPSPFRAARPVLDSGGGDGASTATACKRISTTSGSAGAVCSKHAGSSGGSESSGESGGKRL